MQNLSDQVGGDGRIRFQCPNCKKRYSVYVEMLGKSGSCPKCESKVKIPNPSYEMVYKDLVCHGVTLRKFRALNQEEFIRSESAYVSLDGQLIHCEKVFSAAAIDRSKSQNCEKVILDASVVQEIESLYPGVDPFLKVSPTTSLVDAYVTLQSDHDREFGIFLSVFGDNLKSASLCIDVSRVDRGRKSSSTDCLLYDCYHTVDGKNQQSFCREIGESNTLTLNGDRLNYLKWNFANDVKNDISVSIKHQNKKGISLEDKLLISGLLVDRLFEYDCHMFPDKSVFREIEANDNFLFYSKRELDDATSSPDDETNGRYKIVYILTNPTMPGIVKIGRTTQGVKTRMDQLNTTGVAQPYVCFYASHVGDDVAIEKLMHETFAAYRVNKRREFFEISPQKVMRELIKLELGDATET